MKFDRELLELAAKAAGVIGDYWSSPFQCGYWVNGRLWNPLTNDGDALWLAVKLRLSVTFEAVDEGMAVTINHRRVIELCGDDPDADPRRAIVRAAAEIGRRMNP